MDETKTQEKKKIVVIEDEEDLVSMYKEILTDAGFDVYTALNGSDGIKLVAEQHPALVLLDLMMPGMDGMQVLGQLKENPEKYGTGKVIILTNLSSEVTIKDSFTQKADGYLMKAELTPMQIVKEVQYFIDN